MIDSDDVYLDGFDHEQECETEISHFKLVHETEKAWLIRRAFGRKVKQAWFPKSVCELFEEETLLFHPEWFDPKWEDFIDATKENW